jgi:hypothetical protein
LPPFHLNETTRFVQNNAVSYTVHKKREGGRNGAVLKALWVFFFPWTRETGEEEDLFSPVSHRLPFPR